MQTHRLIVNVTDDHVLIALFIIRCDHLHTIYRWFIFWTAYCWLTTHMWQILFDINNCNKIHGQIYLTLTEKAWFMTVREPNILLSCTITHTKHKAIKYPIRLWIVESDTGKSVIYTANSMHIIFCLLNGMATKFCFAFLFINFVHFNIWKKPMMEVYDKSSVHVHPEHVHNWFEISRMIL